MISVADLSSFFSFILTITVWTATEVCSKANSLQDQTCQKQLDEVYSARITVQSPPQLTGLWTSTQCEIRPGPEFLIRKYRFFDGGLFELIQIFFSDSHCHRPSFAVEARGQFKLYQASWVIPGATEVDYQPRYVTLVPYTNDAAAALEMHLNGSSCRLQSPWQPFERHVIFHFVEDDNFHKEAEGGPNEDGVVDCLSSLEISFHELQLVRIEEEHLGPDNHRSLLLGDVHPDRSQRTAYRPTGYQEPLASAENLGCRLCRLIGKSSDAYPPQLPIRPRPPAPHLLPGSWVSLRCETRNYGVFLTRSVRFLDDGLLWERREFHFADGLCQKLKFMLLLRGTYLVGEKNSEVIEDAFNVNIQVLQVTLTVSDKFTVRQLTQASTCGQPEVTWEPGMEQDVTSTNGCPALDIVTYPTERDVILIDRRPQQQTLLYLGREPGITPSGAGEQMGHIPRPTSFLPPLVRCSGSDDFRTDKVDRLPYIGNNPEGRNGASEGPRIAKASNILLLLTVSAILFLFLGVNQIQIVCIGN